MDKHRSLWTEEASDAGSDAGSDAPTVEGPQVTEKPAPECHDVEQQAEEVSVVATTDAVPTPKPLTELAPGRYVLTTATEYETATTHEPPFQTTAVVTETRFYVRSDSGGRRDTLTTDWSIQGGKLKRTVLCRESGVGATVEDRVDVAPGGYIVYVTSAESRPLALRYERQDD